MADVKQALYQMLRSNGLSPQQALGAMISMGGESGARFDPNALNKNDPGGSYGIAQMNGPRRVMLNNWAAAHGLAPTDPTAQIGDIGNQLQTTERGALNRMLQAKTAQEANQIWTKRFERPAIDNSATRWARRSGVGSVDDQGNFIPGVPGTTLTSRSLSGAALPASGQTPSSVPETGQPVAPTGPTQVAQAPQTALDAIRQVYAPPGSTPATPPQSAFDAIQQVYAQKAPAAAPGPDRSTIAPSLGAEPGAIPGAVDPNALAMLIAKRRAQMGFSPIDMGVA